MILVNLHKQRPEPQEFKCYLCQCHYGPEDLGFQEGVFLICHGCYLKYEPPHQADLPFGPCGRAGRLQGELGPAP